MAIIYSYPKVTSPLATDVLVLTDTTLTAGKRKNKTKSLAMSDLASYVISSTSAITGGGTFNKIPLWTPDGLKLGDSIVSQSSGDQGVTVTGQLDVTQDFNVTGDAILATAEVTGLTQLNGTLTVQGASTFNDASVLNGSVTINDQLIDGTGSPGTAGQVLSSTGGGDTAWINNTSGTSTDLIKKDVTLTATQMLTLQNSGSLELIAAPGAGKLIAVMNLVYYLDYNSVQYNFAGALGQSINFYIGTTPSRIIPFNTLNAVVDKYGSLDFPNSDQNTLIEPNVAFTLQAASGVTVSQGNSPFKLSILYREVVLP